MSCRCNDEKWKLLEKDVKESSIKLQCTRVSFGFAQDKLPMKPNKINKAGPQKINNIVIVCRFSTSLETPIIILRLRSGLFKELFQLLPHMLYQSINQTNFWHIHFGSAGPAHGIGVNLQGGYNYISPVGTQVIQFHPVFQFNAA